MRAMIQPISVQPRKGARLGKRAAEHVAEISPAEQTRTLAEPG
jgi:hypothetical protein